MNPRDLVGALEKLNKKHNDAGPLLLGELDPAKERDFAKLLGVTKLSMLTGHDIAGPLSDLPDEILTRLIAEIEYPDALELVIITIGLKCGGMFRYTAGALELSPALASQGMTIKVGVVNAWQKVCNALHYNDRKLTYATFNHCLEAAAQRYWQEETPRAELERIMTQHSPDQAFVDSVLLELFKLYRWPSEVLPSVKIWLSGWAGRVINPGTHTDNLLTLIGPGGTGKTAFFAQLALDAGPAATLQVSHAGDTRKMAEAVKGATVGVFEELDTQLGNGKKSAAALKELITLDALKARAAFGHFPELTPLPALGATANAGLNSSDGARSRRNITIECLGSIEEGQKRYKWLTANRTRLQAAAAWLYAHDTPTVLPHTEVAVMSEINKTILVKEQEWESYLLANLDRLATLISSEGEDGGILVTRLTPDTLAYMLGEEPYSSTLAAIRELMLDNGWKEQLYLKGLGRGRHPSLIPAKMDPDKVTAIPIHPDNREALRNAFRQ